MRRPVLLGIGALLVMAGCSQAPSQAAGLPRTVSVDPSQTSLVVRISRQTLELREGSKLIRTYPVSTSRYGIGSQQGSFKTPLGRHRIAQKIGDGAPLNTVFKERVNTGRIAVIDRSKRGAPQDDVTTRILWLEGLEPGKNRGRGVDSKERFIYIHGTTSEGLIGSPASNGCVRMYNRDVAQLFDLVSEGTQVLIVA